MFDPEVAVLELRAKQWVEVGDWQRIEEYICP